MYDLHILSRDDHPNDKEFVCCREVPFSLLVLIKASSTSDRYGTRHPSTTFTPLDNPNLHEISSLISTLAPSRKDITG